MSGAIEWILFLALSAVAIGTSASLLLTMSMYRAGLALMSSFVALAGLFVLLDADLLAAIQIMMNVGGMLVMILVMVMAMMDPGGEMMWDMKRKMHLRGPGALSMTMPREGPATAQLERAAGTARDHPQQAARDWTCPMHPEVSQPGPGSCPKCGMALVRREPPKAGAVPDEPGAEAAAHGGNRDEMRGMHGMGAREHHQMMVDMAMSTTQLPWALALGAASALVLVVLAVRTAWPVSAHGPGAEATAAVGALRLSRYMIAFEGAAFLILAGMGGAVIFGKAERRRTGVAASPSRNDGQPSSHREHR